MEGLWAPRYSMIDAWRGLAALGVVVNHLGVGWARFDLGHACVMVFFVISGYCIAAATDACQRNHLRFHTYMWRRIRRIYPPYFFALCLFVATRLVKLKSRLGDQLSRSPLVWLQNFTLTQWISSLRHPTSFPHQNPALFVAGFWSLNYEEQFYLVMGALTFGALRFGRRVSAGGVLLMMIPALIWNVFNPTISYGIFIELWVPFSLGVLVFFRLCKETTARMRTAVGFGLLGMVVLSAWRDTGMAHEMRSVYMEWSVASLFAVLLIWLRPLDAWFQETLLGRSLCKFGLITYSLYLTHQMNFRSSEAVAAKLVQWGMPSKITFFAEVAFMCAVASIFWYFCERPFLNKSVSSSTREAVLPPAARVG